MSAKSTIFAHIFEQKILLFLHPRRVNSLVVLGLIAAETVGEGEADGAEAGVFAAQVLA